ncbi:MAG TPA: xanthine dehydrogenase family protein subunit M [Flexilinea sp.]|nr:xanthine dehydrogenase family protein subunit M [Flexilinea sp.]HOP02550.1 xanthine dehydrogenase family protein subunit M [Flexilinea sp.]HPJ64370.1 xanthine dehydrogenase family protein subunit M [Flexilinea sp.]HPR70583.1 xanthine dehydrogenase family protein subunit M [Flexilinea sp.]HQF79786.1 xanthine dehydrogenase family protein subunit M [Flexilinea sp.]
MNTVYLEKEYDYVKPKTLAEALEILETKKNVKIFAGGTDLIVKLKIGSPIEMDTMLDINGIEELKKVTSDKEGITIGAAEKISVLEKNEDIINRFPALYEAFISMASISLRNMATLIGNLCNASPGADTAGPVICYGGSLLIKNHAGERRIKAEDFFAEGGKTVLEPNEIVTSVNIPAPAENTGAAFIKLSRVKADLAKISVSVVLTRENNLVGSCRIAMGSVAGKPLFLKEIGDGLVGKTLTKELIIETAEKISKAIKPRDGGNRTTAAYRIETSKIISRDALEQAWERSGGKLS